MANPTRRVFQHMQRTCTDANFTQKGPKVWEPNPQPSCCKTHICHCARNAYQSPFCVYCVQKDMDVKDPLCKHQISNMFKNTAVLRNAVNSEPAFGSSHIHLNISEVLPLFRRQDARDMNLFFFFENIKEGREIKTEGIHLQK